MTKWVMISGDFVSTGGMDMANLALARRLAESESLALVAHRVEGQLAASPNVGTRIVRRPLGMDFLGEYFLERTAKAGIAEFGSQDHRVIVNGGNCIWNGGFNWVHYVHAAYSPTRRPSVLRRMKSAYFHRRSVRREREAMAGAKLVICNSEATARHVQELVGGVAPERIKTIYYGIDPEKFHPSNNAEKDRLRGELGWSSDRPRVMFVGALGDHRKGFDTVLEAWEILCQKAGWDAKLTVVGSGAEKPLWESRAQSLGIAESVEFLGFRSDVPRLLRAADALVSPTRYEAYGLGVHEALCCGLPAFVSRGAGIAERYPASQSKLLLSDPEDSGELASRLLDWRQNLSLYRADIAEFGRALRSRSWNDMADEIIAICR